MSGICGSTNESQRARVARMNAAMVARGPDEDCVYTDFFSGVSPGARRRRIIDVKGGRQPVSNEDGTVWAALNGEVYNPPAMRDSNSPSTTARRPKGRPTGRPKEVPIRILVTGHNGYLGSVLVPILEQARHGVVGLDSDLFAPCTFGPNAHEVESLRTDVRDHDYGHVFEAR